MWWWWCWCWWLIYNLLLYSMVILVAILTACCIILYQHRHDPPEVDPAAFAHLQSRKQFAKEFLAQHFGAAKTKKTKKKKKKKKKTKKTKRNKKKRVVVSKDVDEFIQEIIEHFSNHYLFGWFKPWVIGLNRDEPSEVLARNSVARLKLLLNEHIWSLVSIFIDRLYGVNYVNFISINLINRINKHISQLSRPADNISINTAATGATTTTTTTTSKNNIPTNPTNEASTVSSQSAASIASSLETSDDHQSQRNDSEEKSLDGSQVPSEAKEASSSSSNVNNETPNLTPAAATTTTTSKVSFVVAAHLASAKQENTLLYELSTFLVHNLLDTLITLQPKTAPYFSLPILRAFYSDALSAVMQMAIETATKPSFINFNLIKLIQKSMMAKNLNFIDRCSEQERMLLEDIDNQPPPNVKFTFDLKKFTLNDMKMCIIEHNFHKLFELIEECEEVECLQNIRMFIISEILDAAVLKYLRKNQKFNKSRLGSERTAMLTKSGESNVGRLNLAAAKSNSILDNLIFTTAERSQANMLESMKKHFNFNADIDSKANQLKKKDIQRFLNQLDNAKKICERKIQVYRRSQASLVTPTTFAEGQLPAEDTFDISYNSELVKSYVVDSPNTNHSGSSGNKFIFDTKPKNKKIFPFDTIMANNYTRKYFKQFLQDSLINRENRSTISKFRKDELLSDCSVYLVEFWEAIQQIFGKFVDHHKQQANNEDGGKTLATIYAESYLIALKIASDARFFYTFSSRFLQLPKELLKDFENFLIGDISLTEFQVDSVALDFDLNTLTNMMILDPARSEDCLNSVNFHKYLDNFLHLESNIYHCLNEEFYAQFLLSTEYDNLLINLKKPRTNSNELIDMKKTIKSSEWQAIILAPKPPLTKEELKNKSILKVSLDGNTVDIGKNQSILLSSLEFPFFGLLSIFVHVQYRLLVKLNIKNIIAKSELALSYSEQMSKLPIDIEQLVTRDIVYYHNIHSRMHTMISNVFCWLNAEFSCSISDVVYRGPESALVKVGGNSSSSSHGDTNLFSFVENLFVDPATDSVQQCQLHFRAHVTAKPAAGMPTKLLQALAQDFKSSWTIKQSLKEFHQFYTQLQPTSRLVKYLFQFRLDDYLWVLMPILANDPGFTYPNLGATPDRLIKQVERQLTGVRQELRSEVKEQVQRTRNRLKFEEYSFKKLLRSDSSNTGEGASNQADENSNHRQSIHIDQMKQHLEQIFALLTSTSYVSRLRLFQQVLKYNPKLSTKTSCLSCELLEHVFGPAAQHQPNDGFNQFMIDVLYSIFFKAFIDFEEFFLGDNNAAAADAQSVSSFGSAKKSANLKEHASKLFKGPRVYALHEPHRSAKLFLLHARSWLHDKSSLDILSFVCLSFNYFERFCARCHESFVFRELNPTKSRPKWGQCEFRLFNLDSFERSSQPAESVGVDALTSMYSPKKGKAILADDFSIEKIDLLSTSISEVDSNLIEPFFQLLLEVFELKGTMIRTMRRTLMFAFQLTFGQTMLSKQMKSTLESIISDTNIVYCLSLIDSLFHDDDGDRLPPVLKDVTSSKYSGMAVPVSNVLPRRVNTPMKLETLRTRLRRRVRNPNDKAKGEEPKLGNIVEEADEEKSAMSNLIDETFVSMPGPSRVFDEPGPSEVANETLVSEPGPSTLMNETFVSTPGPSQVFDERGPSNVIGDTNVSTPGPSQVIDEPGPSKETDDVLANEPGPSNVMDDANASISGSSKTIFETLASEPAPSTTADDQQGGTQAPGDDSPQVDEVPELDENQQREQRLQILAKQLMLSSVPPFLNHLFGHENTVTGFSKCFDVLQDQTLNKQLIYEFLEAFMDDYFREYKRPAKSP